MNKLLLLIAIVFPFMVQAQLNSNLKGSKTMSVTYLGTSPKLTAIKPISSRTGKARSENDVYIIPNKLSKSGIIERIENPITDPVIQSSNAPLFNGAAVKVGFDGGSNQDNAIVNGIQVAPPDTQGDVGPNHYIQMTNSVTTIFDKSGNTLFGPSPNSVFFQNLDPRLAGTNDGDPVVVYDQFEDRWIVSQFAISAGAPYFMLLAVSQTGDPLGAYNQYAIDYGNDFPDYPKLGVWNDALFITTRDFENGNSFAGFSIVAINKFDMYSGIETNAQRFEIDNPDFDGILPADADGSIPPPSGEPHYSLYLSASGNLLNLVTTTIDFETPENSTLNFSTIPVAAYSFFQSQVAQPNGQTLDALPFFLMYRLQYMNFGTHASMLTNHTVQQESGGTFGIRWYEFRKTTAPWSVYQQGTYLPDDGLNRWMGSIAMNEEGDIALGYSVAGSSLNPSIRFAGQTSDQSGTGLLNIAETSILEGTLSSRGTNRWGDYAMMSIDPVDQDFWFTQEYVKNDTSFSGWGTYISEFAFGNPPIALCQDIVVNLDENGSVTIIPEQIDNGSIDFNGGPVTLVLDKDTFDCSNLGENTVSLIVTGSEGIPTSCNARVVVLDNIAPTAVCQDIAIRVRGTESTEILFEQLDGGSTDNCGIQGVTYSKSTFTIADIGENIIDVVVSDSSGNTAVCQSTITVIDEAEIGPPIAVCQDLVIQLNTSGVATITPEQIDNGSSDAIGAPVELSLDITNFDCSNLGVNTVILTVTDASNLTATCTANVTVEDVLLPTVECRNITVTLDSDGQATITPEDLINSDNGQILGLYPWGGSGQNTLYTFDYDINTNDIAVKENPFGTLVGNNLSIAQNPVDNKIYVLFDAGAGQAQNIDRGLYLFDIESKTVGDKIASIVSVTGQNTPNIMDFDSDGNLYFGFKNGEINKFDLLTSTMSAFAQVPLNRAVGMTFDDDENRLIFASQSASRTSTSFFEIDLQGNVNLLFELISPCGATGQAMDYVGGGKIVASGTFGCNRMFAIDLNTQSIETILSPLGISAGGNLKDILFLPQGASDNCEISNFSLSQSSFTIDDIGENTVEITVADSSGNSASCEATVTVRESTPFVTTWNTTVPGESDDRTIVVPTFEGENYNYSVNWGDGQIDSGLTGDATHTYDVSGTYQVSISGEFPRIYFAGIGDNSKIIAVDQWGEIKWTSMEDAFNGCNNLDVVAIDVPDLSQVTNLNRMFAGCNSLIGNTTFNDWDVSTITSMNAFFSQANSFNQDLDKWNVSNVEEMSGMFFVNTGFNGNISTWDVSNVRAMNQMFQNATSFNQDLNTWNTSNVTDMQLMFSGATSFNGDITNWNTSNVFFTFRMFENATAFNRDISSWDVSNVSTMFSMFESATSFDQDLSTWDISSIFQQTPETGMASMFLNASISQTNYDNTLIGWATLSENESQIPLDVVFDGGNSQFCLSELARQNLIDSFGWTITDGGITADCERPFVTTWKTDNEGVSADNQIMIPYNDNGNYTIDWGDGTINTNITEDITHTYSSQGTYQISISGDFTAIKFGGTFTSSNNDNPKLLSVDQWGSASWTSLRSAFSGCTNVKILANDVPDLSMVISLASMFSSTEQMNEDLSNWDFSTITDMSYMFSRATSFNQDVSAWGIENVENFRGFLNGATSFNQDLGTLSMARVLNLEQFFAFSGITPENYDKTLIGWNSQTEINENVYVGADFINYCTGEMARQELISSHGWVIFDAGKACPMTVPFVSTWKTDNPGSTEDNQIRIAYNYIGNYNIDWGDGTSDQDVNFFITHTYETPGTYQITITGTYPEITFGDSFDASKLISIDQWGDSQWTSMEKAFFNCENFQILATDIPDLSRVKNMDRMFANADSMNSNLSDWDFSTVEDMRQMFAFNSVFNQDISTWNVSSVNNMARMFYEAEQFNQDLGNWNISNVTNMFEIFRESGLSDENYDKILQGWSAFENLQLGVVLGAQTNNYCEGGDARQILIDDFNWTVEDRGENCATEECDVLVNLALNKIATQSSTYGDGVAGIAVDGNTFGDSPWTAEATLQHTVSGEFQPWWQVDLGEVAAINGINVFNRTDKLQSRLNNFYVLFSDKPFSPSSSLDDLLSNNGVTAQFFEGEAGLQETLEFGGSGQYVRIQLSGNGTIHMAEVEVLGCSGEDITRPFVTTWKTDNPGTSEDNQITIPTFDGETYDYTVDWGDGTRSDNVTGDITHTYPIPGTYTVSISGDFPRIYFNYYGDSNKVLSVDKWGSIKWSSMEDAFSGAFNLDVIAEDIPDLSQVTTTQNMFANCRNLKGTISFDNWDVSNVKNMDSMFVWALLFNQQLGEWDVSKVENMNYMFGFNLAFNGDISNWNTSNVEIMAGMFDTANSFNQDIGNWNVSSVKDMSYMFLSMETFNQDISGWDVSNVTKMTETFQSSPLFDQDLSSWMVSNVTDMSRIFNGSGLSNENYDKTLVGWIQLPSLQSGVQLDAQSNQYCLSEEARQSIIDTYGWVINDGGKANDCEETECTSFTNIALNKTASQSTTYGNGVASIAVDGNTFGDSPWTAEATLQHTVSGEFQSWWQVDLRESSVIKGVNIFNRTDKLQGRLNNFYVLISEMPFGETATLSELLVDDTIMSYFFDGEAGLEENIDFETNGRYVRIQLSGTGTLHMAEVEVMGCTGEIAQRPFVTTWKTDNPGLSEDNQITIPTFPGETYNYTVDWGDGTTSENVTGDITHTYTAAGIYTVSISGDFPSMYFANPFNNNDGDDNKILSIDQWGTIIWRSMTDAFSGCDNLDMKATDIPNLSQVPRLNFMFAGCTSLVGNPSIADWDVSAITNMNLMFQGASMFNQNIGNWDVGFVDGMNGMFLDCASFNQDIGGWNVGNVENFGSMFSGASSFNQNIGNWNVSKGTTMNAMFSGAESFNQDIGAWDVSNVTNFVFMFSTARSFNQDISAWNMGNAEFLDAMFSDAEVFNQNIGNWTLGNSISLSSMFKNSNSFNQDLSSWDISQIEFMFEMFTGSGLSNENYDKTLIGWSQLPSLQSGVQLDAPSNQYCLSEEARQSIINTYGWTINDGGKAEDCQETECTSFTNIALNKSASQSTTYGDGVASIAVDGNTFGDSPWTADATLQHTVSGEFQSWWQVDLGESSAIKGINVFNRTDKLQSRLNNFYILISETPFSEAATLSELLADGAILNYFFEGEAGLEENFDFDTNGRYVRVQLSGTGTLHMAEVQVLGCEEEQASRPFVTTWKTDNPGTSEDTQISIPTFPGENYNYTVAWGDGTTVENVTGNITHTYAVPGIYTVSISGEFPRIYFNDAFDISNNDSDKIITINSWGNMEWSSMQAAFAGCDNLDVIANDIPDLSAVNSTTAMFLSCVNLVGNSKFNEWNMASVTEMQAMFNRAISFNQPLNNWNTSNVINANGMFSLAISFNQALNSWNMANAENIGVMFGDAISFNQPLNEWNTSSVVNMNGVFGGAVAFNHSLESWDVSNVGDMSSMLSGSGLSNENYDATLIGWSLLSSLQNNVELGALEKEYCISEVARQSIIDTYGWVINDAGKAEDCGAIGCLKPGNLAFNKPTEQSTTYGNGLSLYAVDGNIVGESPWSADLQHTISGESQSWWQVDLEGNFSIENIVIFNRTDKLQSRLNNFYVLVSETPFSPTATLDQLLTDENIEHIFFEGAAGLESEITFETTGRYVRVQLSDVGTLHMAEFQVFGCSITVPLTANLNDMNLYPNPANDFINVSFDELAEVKAFFVYDISGRIIQRSKPERNENSYLLNVAQLPTGTYFVKAIAVDGVEYYKRMVIKR